MTANKQYIQQLKCLLIEHKNCISKIILHDEHRHLLDYVNEWCKFMKSYDYEFKFRTKVWYTINELQELVKCRNPNCQKPLIKDVITYDNPGLKYCDNACKKTDPNLSAHMSEVTKSFSEEKKAAKVMRRKATCLERYGDENYRNDSKREQTLQMKYGEEVTNSFQAKEVRQKIEQTNIQRYGVAIYAKSDEFISKTEATNMAKYGVPYYSQTEESKQRVKSTCLKVYGSENPLGNEEVKAKSRRTCYDRYGCASPTQNREVFLKQRRRYVVDMTKLWPDRHGCITFDSKAEIAFYIFCVDNGLVVTYQPDVIMTYEFRGKTHSYFPDFSVNGRLVELKGDHFFTDDGKMFCPFRNADESDEQYRDRCGLYEAKHQCMISNDVKIIRSDEQKKYIQYVSLKYGSNFLSQFKHESK